MRAYYFDNIPGDQRLLHDSGESVSDEVLKSIGVLHWHIPTDQQGQIDDAVAEERDYKNKDIFTVTKENLGDLYEPTLKIFYEEHMHEDKEIRYILEGGGFFDIRNHPIDSWIRIQLEVGDLVLLPAGIYHRFTLDETNMIKAIRVFKDDPRWIPHFRNGATDANPYRVHYMETFPSTD